MTLKDGQVVDGTAFYDSISFNGLLGDRSHRLVTTRCAPGNAKIPGIWPACQGDPPARRVGTG